jgi:tRNA threonylcarbamoyladenosine biosynthesis protein TsaE
MTGPNVSTIELGSHEEMIAYGRQLAAELRPGDVILLHGDLGAGKTTLVQGIAAGLGVAEAIQSPTFGLVAEHRGWLANGDAVAIHHLDLYRLESPDDLEDLGYEQYIAPVDGVSFIEWPERAADWLPDRFLLLTIEPGLPGGRRIQRSWRGETFPSSR